MASDKAKKIISHISLYAILIFLAILVAQTIGLGRTGFDSTEVLTQFFFYAAPGGIFLTVILLLYAAELFTKEGDSQYGDSVAFASPKEPPALLGKMFSNPLKLFLISIIVFGMMGLYSTYTNTTFTGVGTLKQQFAFLDSVLYSAVLVPASENAGSAFLFAFFLFFFRRYAKKNNLGKANFVVTSIFAAVILFGLYGWFNHLLRYGGSDLSILTVIIFWAVGGLITAISGSFIPFWVMHLCNNLFFDLKQNFSDDTIFLYTIVGIVLIGISYIFLFVRRGKKDAE